MESHQTSQAMRKTGDDGRAGSLRRQSVAGTETLQSITGRTRRAGNEQNDVDGAGRDGGPGMTLSGVPRLCWINSAKGSAVSDSNKSLPEGEMK